MGVWSCKRRSSSRGCVFVKLRHISMVRLVFSFIMFQGTSLLARRNSRKPDQCLGSKD
jgi:hypothetical protein